MGTRHWAALAWGIFLSFFSSTIGLLLILMGSTLLLLDSSSMIASHPPTLYGIPTTPETVAVNGADLWDADTSITSPSFDFSLSATGTRGIGVSSLFEAYYASHQGTLNLGEPLTVAFPTAQGWMQFFGSDALLLPSVQPQETFDKADPLRTLMASGQQDSATGIKRLPLLQALLTAGSQVPLGDDGSSFTYVDLRKATQPDQMLLAPTTGVSGSPSRAVESRDVFIKSGTRSNKEVGHLIPPPFWSYINRADISPDGWETDFGLPLTEALPFSITQQGRIHRFQVQAFTRDAVVLDDNILDASIQPVISRLNTGIAYLRTIGPPPIAVQPQQGVWAQAETTLVDAPGRSQAIAHVGLHFPLTLLGDAAWRAGMLWYHVGWDTPQSTRAGWVQASRLTFDSPGQGAGWASFDALSPTLAAYLASIGSNMGVAVYDVTRQRYYTYHASAQFIMGSSIKVPILLTFLDMIEREHRQPSAYEMYLLTTMIENSNNDSAGILYHTEVGDAAGVAAYLHRIGLRGFLPYPGAFGWSVVTPLAMVNLLTDLSEGKILTAHDRSLALGLMENIEADQQVGGGETAPTGAIVAMKDGWVPGPDNLWAMNSSSIVTVGKETYIISVYTQEQNSLEEGQAIAQHVCRTVASLLA